MIALRNLLLAAAEQVEAFGWFACRPLPGRVEYFRGDGTPVDPAQFDYNMGVASRTGFNCAATAIQVRSVTNLAMSRADRVDLEGKAAEAVCAYLGLDFTPYNATPVLIAWNNAQPGPLPVIAAFRGAALGTGTTPRPPRPLSSPR